MTKANAPPIEIEEIRSTDPDLDEINAIGAASFPAGTRMDMREEAIRPFTLAWVARHKPLGRKPIPVGYVVTWHVADELHILNIATAESHRRRGIGLALMNQALAHARDRQVRLVVLEVRTSNQAAIMLYRFLGFFAIGLRPGYYSDNGEDAVEMVLVLDPDTGQIVPGRDEVHV